MYFSRATPKLEFRCAPEDLGVIAEPVQSKTVLPDWFRKLPAVDKARLSHSDNALTIKRCMPFLDALTASWIIPIAATMRLEVKDGGTSVTAGWEFDKVMMSNHHSYQIAGNPTEPSPPCKFHNYWTIATPKGWSCLFVPPLNRSQPLFTVLSGIVDTDSYQSLIHFPFIPTAVDGVHVIEKGTPLVQVIPFPREALTLKTEIRAETPEESERRDKISRNTQSNHSWYREHARSDR